MNIFFLDKLNDYNKLLKNGEIPHIKLTEVLDYSIDHMQERVIDMPMIERTLNTITSGKKIIDHMLELC